MDLKCLVVLCVLGVVSGFTIPEDSPQSSFASSYNDAKPSSPAGPHMPVDEGATRNKRHLLFKKYKKGGGESITINRHYEQGSSYDNRPGREVHHHHHFNQYPQAPSYVDQHYYEPRPRPSQQEYHHYHGHNEGGYAHQGSGQYSGGYSSGGYYASRPSYGQYGPPPAESGPVGANPVGQSHNAVDRGQGAAAVNNIAIIHARAGVSHNHGQPEELSKQIPMDLEDFSRQALGME